MAYKDKEKRKQYKRQWSKQWYKDNREKILQKNKQWRKDNPEYEKQRHKDNRDQKLQYSKQWYKDNLEYCKQYRKDNKEHKKQYNKQYHQDNREHKNQNNKQWYKDNRDQKLQYSKQWYQYNKERINQSRKTKYQTDPMFRLNDNMRCVIRSYLKTNNLFKNNKHWEDLVGYTLEDLKLHLETQFEPWMNWDNFGRSTIPYTKWSLDHIVPLSAFNFTSTNDEEFKLAWDLSNLQPLDSYINLYVKRDRLDYYIEFPLQK
jgi:hypothetical protein